MKNRIKACAGTLIIFLLIMSFAYLVAHYNSESLLGVVAVAVVTVLVMIYNIFVEHLG